MSPLTGRCQCGAVGLEISAPLAGAAFCHCKRCQRRTGTGVSITGLTQPGSLTVTDGAAKTWDPGDGGWVKAFCADCGSQLYTSDPAHPDRVAVRLGVLDQDPGVRPGLHQFVAYAAPWAPVPDDGLPRFEERMTWE